MSSATVRCKFVAASKRAPGRTVIRAVNSPKPRAPSRTARMLALAYHVERLIPRHDVVRLRSGDHVDAGPARDYTRHVVAAADDAELKLATWKPRLGRRVDAAPAPRRCLKELDDPQPRVAERDNRRRDGASSIGNGHVKVRGKQPTAEIVCVHVGYHQQGVASGPRQGDR